MAAIYYGATTFSLPFTAEEKQLLMTTRLPRVLASFLTGAMLGSGGVVLRKYTQNDLADPGLLGVASGSQLLLVLLLAFYPKASYMWQQAIATLGSALLLALLFIVQKKVNQPLRFLLFGVALSALMTSVTSLLASKYHLYQYLTQWSAGGLQLVTWKHVFLLSFAFLIGLFFLIKVTPSLQLYETNPELSFLLGVNQATLHLQVIIVLALFIGVATSVVGNLFFFGIMIVLFVKGMKVDGEKEGYVAIFIGGGMMMLADLIARTWAAPAETSLFAVIALLASLVFFYFVRQKVNG